jgi:hypothetical protein
LAESVELHLNGLLQLHDAFPSLLGDLARRGFISSLKKPQKRDSHILSRIFSGISWENSFQNKFLGKFKMSFRGIFCGKTENSVEKL